MSLFERVSSCGSIRVSTKCSKCGAVGRWNNAGTRCSACGELAEAAGSKLSPLQRTALQALTDTFGGAPFKYMAYHVSGGLAHQVKGKKRSARVNRRSMDVLIRKGYIKRLPSGADKLPHEKGYESDHTYRLAAKAEAALTEALTEALDAADQKLADDIVELRDPNDEVWREVRHRLHGHPAGIPGVERDGVVEAVPPTGANCEKCRRAGRGDVAATTMRKGAWGVWSYLCPTCADPLSESTAFKPEWPDTAEDDKAFVILWADGRGICAFRHKRDAQAFASKKSNDVVWVHYESPVRKIGRTGHRKNVRLRVANSYEPKQEDREINADGTFSCGVFLPVPYNLARQFPDKSEEDDSVPHLTLLFAGDLSVADYQKLVEVVQTVARAYEPFTLTMDRYHEFTNNDGQTIPHMTASPNLGRLHAALRATAEVEGIPIDHSYGPEEDDRPYADQFKTHATLAYVDKGEPAYSGPKPTGSWRVIDLEVWGHERQRFPLGSIAADQPADEPVTALERAMEALDLARARPAEEAAMGRFDALLEQESTSLLDRVLDEAGKLKYTKPGKLFGKAVIVKQKKKKPKAPPDEQKALAATQKKILKVANKITGTKLKVQNANVSHKGMDFYFAGGGRFKVRPRSDGSITAKLQGRPKPHYRYRGDGPSLDQALASMKAEKKGKHGQTVTAIDAITKGLSPAITPKVKGKKAKPSVPAGPTSEKVNGVMLFNDMGVDQKVWDRYAMALKDSANLVKKRGFGFMLGNFIMHLRKGTGGAYGNYDMKKKIIEIFVPVLGYKASNESIMLTMVHEMGHHYYYREIPRPKRKEYRWYFDKAKETGGEFATAYGSTKRYEDFAEIFAGYIGKGHQIASKKSYVLTPDIMQRFRTYLAFDNRINLKEDEDKLTGLSGRRPLWTLPEPGVFCETCSCGYDEDDE